MQSGILYGTAAMIDGLIDQLSATLSTTPRIIATGGMSKTIAPHCRHQITIDPYLLFKGLFQSV
jgi:type III pantothenate kinase